jgi:hypothetical protein
MKIMQVGQIHQPSYQRPSFFSDRLCRMGQADFRKAKEKVMHKKKEGVPEGLYL